MIHFKRKIKYMRINPAKCAVIALVIVVFVYLWYRPDDRSPLRPRRLIESYRFGLRDSGHFLDTYLVVMIVTAPKNSLQRNTIRKTWLSQLDKQDRPYKEIRYWFVMGTKSLPEIDLSNVRKEQKENGDLLLLDDLEDSYDKLTMKLALMCEWAVKNWKFQVLMKVDDDTFVRIDKILWELKVNPYKSVENLYWGYFYGKAHVKQSGPWKETDWKLCDYYLPYARGGGYLLAYDLVQFVARNWRMFQTYKSEDVTLGAWLAPLQLTRVHDTRFDTEYKSRGCSNRFIVSHKQSPQDMEDKHASILSTDNLCKREFSSFHGYEYNWSVPPSQCCVRSENIP